LPARSRIAILESAPAIPGCAWLGVWRDGRRRGRLLPPARDKLRTHGRAPTFAARHHETTTGRRLTIPSADVGILLRWRPTIHLPIALSVWARCRRGFPAGTVWSGILRWSP